MSERLREIGKTRENHEDRLAEIQREKESWAKELNQWGTAPSRLMHPRRLLGELSAALPQNAIVTTDAEKHLLHVQQLLSTHRPETVPCSTELGQLRHCLRVWLWERNWERRTSRYSRSRATERTGSAASAEVMTAVREEIPVIAVVFNNDEWGAEKKNQIDYYDDRFVGTNLKDPISQYCSRHGSRRLPAREGRGRERRSERGPEIRQARGY